MLPDPDKQHWRRADLHLQRRARLCKVSAAPCRVPLYRFEKGR